MEKRADEAAAPRKPGGVSPQSTPGAAPPPQEPGLLELIATLVPAAIPLVDKYIALKEREQSFLISLTAAEAKRQLQITVMLLIFAAGIVGLMAYLSTQHIVSGDALLFMVGTVMGTIFAMIYRQLYGESVADLVPRDE